MSTASNTSASRAAPPQTGSGGREDGRPQTPVLFVISILLAFVGSVLGSVLLGTCIELVGCFSLWRDQGVQHVRAHVAQDLGYLEQFPRAVLVDDTRAFALEMVHWASWPWVRLNAQAFFTRADAARSALARQEAQAPQPPVPPSGKSMQASLQQTQRTLQRVLQHALIEIARALEILLYVTQDAAVRLSVSFFALPAFVLACLLGFIDGLVQRDLRKWAGGRESSFIYHHAKHSARWFLTGGFALYLAWPMGGINPTYMVLLFTVLVAVTLSITVASFKKYL